MPSIWDEFDAAKKRSGPGLIEGAMPARRGGKHRPEISEDESLDILIDETSPEKRAQFRESIDAERDPAKKKILQQGYDQDTEALIEHGKRRGVAPFDPEGIDYDMASARSSGLKADRTGHWPSRDPKTGLLLKGRRHPTWHKTEKGEQDAGMEIFKGEDGRYYSRPRSVAR